MTPKNLQQNLILWSAALLVAVALSFLASLAQQLPGDAPIRWREVWLDVIKTLLTTAPVVAAGFGLPRLGREGLASLVSEVGPQQAQQALEIESIKQQTGVREMLTDRDIGRLADRVLAEQARRQARPAGPPRATSSPPADFDSKEARP